MLLTGKSDFPAERSGAVGLKTERATCTRCIMDTTDPDIQFDAQGVCNHCHRYDRIAASRLFPSSEQPRRLASLVHAVKADGVGKKYDCIIGVSGGVDSTYVAYLTHKLGLRPLAVHFD